MSLLTFKLFASLFLFIIAYFCGLLATKIKNQHQQWLILGDLFAGGVFLGASLFHMLPDAFADFSLLKQHAYLYSFSWYFGGVLILLLLEYIILTANRHAVRANIMVYILAVVLAIHSLIEGGALGVNNFIADAFIIFIAILAHKGSASFALAIKLRKNKMSHTQSQIIIILFSLMTPLGILLASSFTLLLTYHQGIWLEACFNAFAAGTFFYLGIFQSLREHLFCLRHFSAAKVLALLSGFVLMAAISFFV